MPVTSFHPTRIPNVRSWETFSTPLAHRYTFFTIPLKRRASSSWRAGASTSSIPAAYAGSFAFLFTMLMARLSPVRCAALAPLPRLRLRFSCRLSAFFLSPPAIGRCTCERAGWSLSAPRAQGIPLAPKGGSGRQCAAASGCGGAAGRFVSMLLAAFGCGLAPPIREPFVGARGGAPIAAGPLRRGDGSGALCSIVCACARPSVTCERRL